MIGENWIRQGRRERGLSQANLARVTGIVQATISQWELGKAEPSKDEARQIQAVFRQLDDGRIPEGLLLRNHRGSASVAKKGSSRRSSESVERTDGWFPPVTLQRRPPGAEGSRPIAVACFAGCGGMALGFRQAGFSISGFVEIDDDARATFSANFPQAVPLACDVRDITAEHVRNWKSHIGDVSVLCGGPPCQGFSLAGKRDKHDARNTLVGSYIQLAEYLSPEVVVMENVRVLTSMKTPGGIRMPDYIREEFARIGYEVEYRELNAQDFGVPQFRERVFFIAVRRDLLRKRPPFFPAATHGVSRELQLFGPMLRPYATFRDATGDLEPLRSGQASGKDPYHWAVDHPDHVLRWLRDVPEGHSAHENKDPSLRPPSGYNTTYKRLRWDEPCSTIGTTFGMISACRTVHPTQTRSLTMREAMRCQTFPDDYVWKGSTGSIRTQIGNAVPPRLSAAIARNVISTVLAMADCRRVAS